MHAFHYYVQLYKIDFNRYFVLIALEFCCVSPFMKGMKRYRCLFDVWLHSCFHTLPCMYMIFVHSFVIGGRDKKKYSVHSFQALFKERYFFLKSEQNFFLQLLLSTFYHWMQAQYAAHFNQPYK